ncbi:probable WRKY transcription factor 70 [Cucurbita moschata]|uniref:Probable WRKY transcription factor 70 n=1 Tax=Cucurbita moschata TaxID=3662 RepID=A0A6J1FLS6_CUCMO|nr:probable WRKY transcription factor 70 [Cucurbita moschata]
MDCSWVESTPFDRKKVADQLLRGHEFARQLQAHLRSGSSCGGTVSDDLVAKILSSFSKTISVLNRSSDADDINGSIVDNSPPEESEDSCRSSTPNDRRGCYKRRRNSHSWARDSSSLVDDGHAWRKYGQKSIQNAKFPRNYYRCTHKFDQGCQASKQVQRVEEHPPKFRTTYYGHHTCTNFLNTSDIVLGSSNFDDSGGVLLSFDSPTAAAPAAVHDHERNQFFLPADTDADAMARVVKTEVVMGGTAAEEVCSPSDYMSAGPSPDDFSEVMMSGSIGDFEDDVLQFHF